MENLRELPKLGFDKVKNQLGRAQGQRDAVARRLSVVSSEVKTLEAEEEILDLVAGLFRTLIDTEVLQSVSAVEKLLSEGLQAIFEDMDLQVKANVETQRGKVSVELITLQKQADGSTTEASSVDAYGGSVSTVQSVLLRLIVLLRRGMTPLILLDESLGAIADQYVPAVGKFLTVLCDNMGVDILAVTHNPLLVEAADKAYHIRKLKGKATFKEGR